MEKSSATTAAGTLIHFFRDQKIGEGVDKVFYETTDPAKVIGFYKSEAVQKDDERKQRLEKIVLTFNPTTGQKDGVFWKKRFCWPETVVTGPRLGFVAPRISDDYFFDETGKEKKSIWFTNPRLLDRLDPRERGDLRQRLMTCRNLAQAVGRLHHSGLAHSDLSGNNVLLNPKNHGCMLIDLDALVVPGLFPPDVLGTKKYMAPELTATAGLPLHDPRKNLPSITTDLHSLAVIIYELLFLRHPLEGPRIFSRDVDEDDDLRFGKSAVFIEDPKDDSNRPAHLAPPVASIGEDLSALFIRALSPGLHFPENRPTALEWEDALSRVLDRLIPCPKEGCRQKWFVCRGERNAVCPYCSTPVQGPYFVMRLFRRYDPGRFRYENHYIAIHDRKTIHPWHVRADIPVPTDLDVPHGVSGIFFFTENGWVFRNEGQTPIFCNDAAPIYPAKTARIGKGSVFLLSRAAKGKLAVFEIGHGNAKGAT